MVASFVIVFRETLEAALIIGIILSYLYKTKQAKYDKFVYLGVAAGLIASISAAALFTLIAGGFEGAAEKIFEGGAMLLAAALITGMILWMLRQRHTIRKETEQRVQMAIEGRSKLELFLLPMVAVLREGVETVIFLGALSFAGSTSVIAGGLLGMLAAIVIGYLIFAASKKVNLKTFFTATSIFLILLAAGLSAHAVHDFQELGALPVIVEHVWDSNAVVDENGAFGSMLKSMLGYNGNPSLLEVIVYVAYIAAVALAWKRIGKIKHAKT